MPDWKSALQYLPVNPNDVLKAMANCVEATKALKPSNLDYMAAKAAHKEVCCALAIERSSTLALLVSPHKWCCQGKHGGAPTSSSPSGSIPLRPPYCRGLTHSWCTEKNGKTTILRL